jgi:hypothetical protein
MMSFVLKIKTPAGSPYQDPEKMREVEAYFNESMGNEDNFFSLVTWTSRAKFAEPENWPELPPLKDRWGRYTAYVHRNYKLRLVKDVLTKVFGLEIVSEKKDG